MRLRSFHIVIAFLSLVFFSCGKELSYERGTQVLHDSIPVHDSIPRHDTLPPVVSSTDTFYATINGKPWVAVDVVTADISGQLVASGADSSGSPSVSLIIPDYIAPLNYILDVTKESNYIGLYNPSGAIGLTSTGGTLTILENNTVTHRLRGSFQFQASDRTGKIAEVDQLTKGYFSVHYNP